MKDSLSDEKRMCKNESRVWIGNLLVYIFWTNIVEAWSIKMGGKRGRGRKKEKEGKQKRRRGSGGDLNKERKRSGLCVCCSTLLF